MLGNKGLIKWFNRKNEIKTNQKEELNEKGEVEVVVVIVVKVVEEKQN